MAENKRASIAGFAATAATPAPAAPRRGKAKQQIGVTLRLTPDESRRIWDLKLDRGVDIQTIGLAGLNLVFRQLGLPELRRLDDEDLEALGLADPAPRPFPPYKR
jgi:hypothetical protein